MAAIEVKIENWKKRLLDLGKRNRLLNYRETKRSNIKITIPELAELYSKLVIEEKALSFSYPFDEQYEDFPEEDYNSIQYGDIETNRTIKEQQKTLRNLRDKAKTSIEEQGVNILYLSFGFLKWKESTDSDQVITSPIVLVPVSLTLESITSPFVLNLHEDEIVVNPTLIYKLENDFGIRLPEFDGHEDDITIYLAKIQKMVAKNTWAVVWETGLSLLSFLKINMYKDLENNKEKIAVHSVLKALSGDISDIRNLSNEYNCFNHDSKIRPIDTYQIVDADSSQQDAILYSKKGISFVLQGPPGTGKSQTITNIISEALADGKRVLFVSEKMAALEVVYRRLSQSGLSDFCLTLHSHKANKKAVLTELGKTLNTSKVKLQEDVLFQLETLQNQRDKLNRYASELHTPCQPLNKTIYDVNGKLAKLYDKPDVIFTLDCVGETTPEKLHKYIYLLTQLANTIGKMSEDFTVNPWRGCCVDSVSHELRHDIETYLRKLMPKLNDLAKTFESICNEFELGFESSIKTADELIDVLELAAKSPLIPVNWIYEEDITPLVEKAEVYRNLKAEYNRLFSEISALFTQGYFNLSASGLSVELEAALVSTKQIINTVQYPTDADIVSSSEKTLQTLETIKKLLAAAFTSNELIAEKFGIKPCSTLKELNGLKKLLDRILTKPNPTKAWFDDSKSGILVRIFADAQKFHCEMDNKIKELTAQYDKEILTIDHSSMLKRFRTEYTSIFKIFNKNYRNDRNTIRALAINMPKKIADSTIISVLNELQDIANIKAWINDNEETLNLFFGKHYHGEYTDWDELENALKNFSEIKSYFSGESIPANIKSILLSEVSNTDYIKSSLAILDKLDSEKILAQLKEIFEQDEYSGALYATCPASGGHPSGLTGTSIPA